MKNKNILVRLMTTAGAAIASSGAVQAMDTSTPWNRVVALPTACYSTHDQFAARNQAALDALVADVDRQKAVNDEISSQQRSVSDADPMELARRMQENMMKDPQAAMKYMQAVGATEDPAAVLERNQAHLKRIGELDAQEKQLIQRYQAARKAALVPVNAKLAALHKKYANNLNGVGEVVVPPAELDMVKRDADQAYQAMCPQWWGATGAVQAYLKSYREFLVNERIPYAEKGDAAKLAQFSMTNTGAKTYRSVATMEAARDYAQRAGRLYQLRNEVANCVASKCADRWF